MTPNQKRLKAKYAVFANQHLVVFKAYCLDLKVEPDFKNYDLLKSFYSIKHSAKKIHKENVKQKKSEDRLVKKVISNHVHRTKVRYNQGGFQLINGDCLNGAKPVHDKAEVCEGKYLVIQ